MKQMRDDIRYIICPDIHGRTFWEKIIPYVEQNKDIEVIFLGDYLDPYPDEYISPEEALENFKNILKFANEYTGRVKLLVGNHDLSYILTPDICRCRYNIGISVEAKELFKTNEYLFSCFHKIKENTTDKHILFSHSVLTKAFYSDYSSIPYESVDYYIVQMNKILRNLIGEYNENFKQDFINLCAKVPYSRGGLCDYGSFVWEDFSTIILNDSIWLDNIDMIVGHTQIYEPMLIKNRNKNTWACDLDCRHNFILTNNDTVELLDNDNISFAEFYAEELKTSKN